MFRFVRRSRVCLKRMTSTTTMSKNSDKSDNGFQKYVDYKRGFRYYVFDEMRLFIKRNMNSLLGISFLCGGGYVYYKIGPFALSLDSPVSLILKSFEEGRGIDSFKDTDNLADVNREKLYQDLIMLLSPKETNHYGVIVGQNGCGKSTAVRKVLSSQPVPRGAIYFNCPVSPEYFSTELIKTLNYIPERAQKNKTPIDIAQEPLASFLMICDHLLASADLFKEKYNRPAVLVIDSADRLAEKDPKLLAMLQELAKDCADKGTLRIVFISSDGSALSLLMSRSAWSRADKPSLEIGEIGDQDAIDFLVKSGVPAMEAEKAVKNITGGLFTSLHDFVSNFEEGKSYDEIVKILDATTKETVLELKIDVNHALFVHLVQHSSIGSGEALEKDMTNDQIQLLLKANILAVHPDKTYTFHDRHVAVWFKKNVKI